MYDDFLRTKLLYHKESGTMFYHMVQSFPADEEVDPAAAHAAAAVHRHTDSKTLRRERVKKIALGHREDDHEDTQTWQQTM